MSELRSDALPATTIDFSGTFEPKTARKSQPNAEDLADLIDNYRVFNCLSDFTENWLKGVYMCQDITCGIIS